MNDECKSCFINLHVLPSEWRQEIGERPSLLSDVVSSFDKDVRVTTTSIALSFEVSVLITPS